MKEKTGVNEEKKKKNGTFSKGSNNPRAGLVTNKDVKNVTPYESWLFYDWGKRSVNAVETVELKEQCEVLKRKKDELTKKKNHLEHLV